MFIGEILSIYPLMNQISLYLTVLSDNFLGK